MITTEWEVIKVISSGEIYEQSNKYTTVDLMKRMDLHQLYLNVLNTGQDINARKQAYQMLSDALCQALNIPKVFINVTNNKQPSTSNNDGTLSSKKLGCYNYNINTYTGKVFVKNITLYNLTAKRQSIVAIKSLTDTFLHEFIHHYDVYYLHLAKSPHTKGFYLRISDLKQKLV